MAHREEIGISHAIAALGDSINLTMREPTVPLSSIGENMDGFRAAVLTFRDALMRVA